MQSREETGLQALKGVNTKAEKSFLCNRGKLIGIDIKDGKRPTRSIPSLRVQSRWSNQGTLVPDFSWWEKQKPPILHQLPSQLRPRVLYLFPWEQPKDRGTKYQVLEMICLCSLQATFKVPLQTHDILMEFAECVEISPFYRWGNWGEQACEVLTLVEGWGQAGAQDVESWAALPQGVTRGGSALRRPWSQPMIKLDQFFLM